MGKCHLELTKGMKRFAWWQPIKRIMHWHDGYARGTSIQIKSGFKVVKTLQPKAIKLSCCIYTIYIYQDKTFSSTTSTNFMVVAIILAVLVRIKWQQKYIPSKQRNADASHQNFPQHHPILTPLLPSEQLSPIKNSPCGSPGNQRHPYFSSYSNKT